MIARNLLEGQVVRKRSHTRLCDLERTTLADRKPFDLDAYFWRIRNSPCFVCAMVAGRLDGNHIVYQGDRAIVFLNKYPALFFPGRL